MYAIVLDNKPMGDYFRKTTVHIPCSARAGHLISVSLTTSQIGETVAGKLYVIDIMVLNIIFPQALVCRKFIWVS